MVCGRVMPKDQGVAFQSLLGVGLLGVAGAFHRVVRREGGEKVENAYTLGEEGQVGTVPALMAGF